MELIDFTRWAIIGLYLIVGTAAVVGIARTKEVARIGMSSLIALASFLWATYYIMIALGVRDLNDLALVARMLHLPTIGAFIVILVGQRRVDRFEQSVARLTKGSGDGS